MLETLDLDPAQIADPALRALVQRVLNVLEDLYAENERLRAEVQRLGDELARRQGGSGRPVILPRVARPVAVDYSSERERPVPVRHRKASKLAEVVIDRVVEVVVPAEQRPPDAVRKGWTEVVVQDVRITVETVCFRREKWWSPSAGQTVVAPLPPGYHGQFGPGVRTLAVWLHHGGQMSQANVLGFLHDLGVRVSVGWLATLVTDGEGQFQEAAAAVVAAGLAASPWQWLDETGTRVDGENRSCHVLGHDLYTAYRTTPRKDRQAVIDVLWPGAPRTDRYDATAVGLLAAAGVAARTRRTLSHLPRDAVLSEADLTTWLAEQLPGLGPVAAKAIRDALRTAAYQARTDGPAVALLLTDDAPQFGGVTAERARCWVHVGRHFAKLTPGLPHHRRQLTRFRRRFWAYYRRLVAYRAKPRPAVATRLRHEFDRLFATETGYAQLDTRIAQTRAQQTELLQVLAHPELPLHTNGAELGARRRVRKRDVSFGPRSEAGITAWDSFQTLAATAAKLGVSLYAYLRDRIGATHALPSLADLSTERARTAHLGASWAPMTSSPNY